LNIINIPLPRGGKRKGRPEQFPDRVIIHAMSEYIRCNGKTYHALEWLEKLKLSAHVFGCPNGDIIRSREDDQEAIHAAGNNYDTLSYEFLVEGVHDLTSLYEAIKKPYLSQMQLENGVKFVKEYWVGELGILRYEKHSTVDPSQEKQDPGGGFPWVAFLKGIGVII
jgi:hypothetical protein